MALSIRRTWSRARLPHYRWHLLVDGKSVAAYTTRLDALRAKAEREAGR